MKNCTFFIVFSLLLNFSYAQQHNNEWINYESDYFKIKIVEESLYRINKSTIEDAGLLPVGDGFQLFCNGFEVPIFVTTDGIMDDDDYIEFYGRPNDGHFDRQLYADNIYQPNPSKSLFSDTAIYYLTWKSGAGQQRYEQLNNDLSSMLSPTSFFMEEIRLDFTEAFHTGESLSGGDIRESRLSVFNKGEGFVSVPINAGASRTWTMDVPHAYIQNDLKATISMRVVGASEDRTVDNEHHPTLSLNGERIINQTYDGLDMVTFDYDFSVLSLSDGSIELTFKSEADRSEIDDNALAYISLNYPKQFDFEGKSFYSFALQDHEAHYLEIDNFASGSSPVLYDLTNYWRIVPEISNGKAQIFLPRGDIGAERLLVLANTASSQAVKEVTNLEQIQFRDFSQTSEQGSYIILAANRLLTSDPDALKEYALHRASNLGGNHTVTIVDMAQLYDQYAYGIDQHPQAIRQFLQEAVEEWATPPEYLLLVGSGVSYDKLRFNKSAAVRALIPPFGNAPSDHAFAMFPNATTTEDYYHLAVGRLPVTNTDQLQAYLAKVKEYDSSYGDIFCDKSNIWRKKIIGLASSGEESSLQTYETWLNNYQNLLINPPFGGTMDFFKNIGATATSIPKLGQDLDEGAGLLLFVGDSRNGQWNIDLPPVADLKNKGRYPLMIGNTCCLGNVFVGNNNQPISVDYVLEADKGAIAYLGHSFYQGNAANSTFLQELLYQLLQENYEGTLGKNILTLLNNPELWSRSIAQSTLLLGDPALHPMPRKQADYSLDLENIRFLDHLGSPLLEVPVPVSFESPYFEAQIPVLNLGRASLDSFNVEVIRLKGTGELETVVNQRVPAPLLLDTISLQIPNDQPGFSGINSFIFFIDSDIETEEDCKNNNSVTQSFNVAAFCDDPPALTFEQDTVALDGSTITLTPTTEAGMTFLWSTGATTPSITVAETGTYTVTITDLTRDCKAKQSVTVLAFPVGFAPDQASNFIMAYPNPVQDQLHLELSTDFKGYFDIIDLTGRLIMSQNIVQSKSVLSTKSLENGFYIGRLYDRDGRFLGRLPFMKQ